MQFYCEPCIFTNKLKSVLQRPENVLAAQLQRQESMQRHSSPQLHALIQQQRMMQRSHLQQQQQQLRHHMQQHNIPPTSLTKQPAMESGLCAHRLMQYLYHQRHHPLDNNIGENLWQKFFVPNAKKRWCLSLYGNVGHHTLGVFPQAAMDVWQCEICGSKPGRGFETTVEVLPRLCKRWLPKSQQLTQARRIDFVTTHSENATFINTSSLNTFSDQTRMNFENPRHGFFR